MFIHVCTCFILATSAVVDVCFYNCHSVLIIIVRVLNFWTYAVPGRVLPPTNLFDRSVKINYVGLLVCCTVIVLPLQSEAWSWCSSWVHGQRHSNGDPHSVRGSDSTRLHANTDDQHSNSPVRWSCVFSVLQTVNWRHHFITWNLAANI